MHHPTSEAAGRTPSASPPAQWAPRNTPASPPVRLVRLLLIVAGLLAAAFVVGLLPRLRERRAVAGLTHELSVPVVTVVSAAPGQAAAPVSLPAEIRPRREASIHARATGYVKQWHVDLGAGVTNGQVLADLDTPELSQELSRAEAAVREAEAALDLAEKTAARSEEMRKVRVISVQESDERAAEKTLRAAQLESARAEVRRLQSLLGFARLTAPFAGTITARRLEVGQLVNAASGTELYRLAQTDSLRVFVRVPQTLASAVATGQVAEVAFNELPGRQFPARVVRTAGALDPGSRTLLTELELPNPDGRILAGGFAQVRLRDAHPEMPLTLPANTLLFHNSGPQVAMVADGGRVALRPVTLGRDLGATVEILTGVTPDDHIVLNPADSLADGAAVAIAGTNATPPRPAK